MRHEVLPQSSTVEQLAQWLYENKIDTKSHTEEEPYTEEEIAEFEHKSSLASRSLDKLDAIEKKVKEYLKEGVHEEPISITIPPTKGRKVLTANRLYADVQIDNGYSYREIDLYGIPDDKSEKILFFDAEGTVWDDYSENMSEDQKHQYIGMFSKEQGEDLGVTVSVEVVAPKTEQSENSDDSQNDSASDTEQESQDHPEEEKSTEAPEANAEEAQDAEQDSVLISEEIDLDEQNQDGAF